MRARRAAVPGARGRYSALQHRFAYSTKRGVSVEVIRLAVAVVDAREDAEHLEVALQPHPLERAPELGEIAVHRKARVFRLLPIARAPVEHALLLPADEGIAQQRHDVVGDRPEHRVLEVEHAGVGLAHHQVARHVVAVHVDHGLRERALHQQAEDALPAPGIAVRCNFNPRCLATYHSGNRFISRRSSASSYGGSSPGRVASCQRSSASVASANSCAALSRVELCQIGARAQVGKQQEALRQVLREDLGRVHAGVARACARRARTAGSPPCSGGASITT